MISAVSSHTRAADSLVAYRVTLIDKGPNAYTEGTPAYRELLAQFSARALERRTRMGLSPIVDSLDAPVYAPYLAEVSRLSSRVLLTLPWFNTVVVECSPEDSSRISTLPFVESVTPVSRRSYVVSSEVGCDPAAYGNEDLQHRILATAPLHNGGVFGTGVLLGVIDTGFRWKAMSTLKDHLRVVEELDLIYGDSATANNDNDPPLQDAHGSTVLSALAGWQHDSLIGIAPFASYILAKTEDMRFERRIEEETYASAVMMLERRGVDIITSSLGYRLFDQGNDSTLYRDLDGSTTWASRALNLAADRGVISVTSAGNDGPHGRTLITPADADSVITVGALDLDGVTPWSKSSWGPTPDGRQKPDFAAPGVRIRTQDVDNSFIRPSGTSISAPFIAGGIALLRELYPMTPPWMLRSALMASAQRAGNPDSVAGYGAPNLALAAALLGPSVGMPVISTIDANRSVFVCVYTDQPVRAELVIRDRITGMTSRSTGVRLEEPWYMFPIAPNQLFRDSMDARIVVTTTMSSATASYPRDSSWFTLPRYSLIIPCGVRLPGSVTSVSTGATTNDVAITHHPLTAGQRQFTISGVPPESDHLRIVHVATGEQLACTEERIGRDRVIVHAPDPLVRGVYMVVIYGTETPITIPMLVQ